MVLEPIHRNDHNLHRVCIDFDADTMQNIMQIEHADFPKFLSLFCLHRLRSDAEICISTMQMQSASFCIKSASNLVPVRASKLQFVRVSRFLEVYC